MTPKRRDHGTSDKRRSPFVWISGIAIIALLSFFIGYLIGDIEEKKTEPGEKIVDMRAKLEPKVRSLDPDKIFNETEPEKDKKPREFSFTKTLAADASKVDKKLTEPDEKIAAPAKKVKTESVKVEKEKAEAPKPKPAVTVAKPPVKTPTPTATKKTSRFVIQAGSFTSINDARSLRKKITRSGHNSFIARFAKGKTTFYRVRVGPYKTRRAAERALIKIKNSLNVNGLIMPNDS